MNRIRDLACRRKQDGAAAVESAFILIIMLTLLTVPLLFGRVFLHYSMAQRAAHDAARLLATAPQRDILWYKLDGGEVGSAALARAIARHELSEALTGRARPSVDVFCDGETCTGDVLPSKIQVIVKMSIVDMLFGGLTSTYTGDSGIQVRADVTMTYAGK